MRRLSENEGKLLKSGVLWGKMGWRQGELAQKFVSYREKVDFPLQTLVGYREKVDQDGLYVTCYPSNSSLLNYC